MSPNSSASASAKPLKLPKNENKQENTPNYGASVNQLPYRHEEHLFFVDLTPRKDISDDRFGLNSEKTLRKDG